MVDVGSGFGVAAISAGGAASDSGDVAAVVFGLADSVSMGLFAVDAASVFFEGEAILAVASLPELGPSESCGRRKPITSTMLAARRTTLVTMRRRVWGVILKWRVLMSMTCGTTVPGPRSGEA